MINTCQTSFQRKHLGWSNKSLTTSITYMSTSHSILHYTSVKINTKIYVNNIEDNYQELYEYHIKLYSNITITIASITFTMTSNRYTNIEAHILRSQMNSIHERHVPSEEKPKRMNHTFLKITRWRNKRKTKINSI